MQRIPRKVHQVTENTAMMFRTMTKLSSSMAIFCLFFYFPIHGSAQYCLEDYVKTGAVNWYSRCILKKACLERGFVIHNGYCLRKCPMAFYLSYDDRTCHRSCPDDTVVNGSNCLNSTQCTARDMFVYNGGCVEFCPLGTVITMADICVHDCPHQTIRNTTRCITPHNCTDDGRVIFNNTCTDQCPLGFPYVDSGECASECQDGKVFYGDQCITQHRCIHDDGKVIQNRSCVESCSPDAPNIYEGQCHSECPSGTVLNASLSTCFVDSVCAEKGQFVHKKTCIAECPRFANGKVCVDECPGETVLYHRECITTTECILFDHLYMYLFNGTCVESCPEEAPNIDDGNRCYAVCPFNKVVEDQICVYKSQCKSKVIHKNKCLQRCPETAPLSAEDGYGTTNCVSECPVNTVIMDKQCIRDSSCTSKQKVIFNGTCIDKCPRGNQYIEDGKCQSECSRNYVKLCFEHCPDNKFAQNITCISSGRCTSQGNFVFSGSCLTKCPEVAPYISDGICHHRCPSSTVKQDLTCHSKDFCTSKGNLFFGGTCLTKCPEEAPYISDGVCHHRCPSSMVKQNFTCFSNDWCTSQGKFVFGGKCLTTCPEEAIYHSSGICHQQCPQGQRATDTECIVCDSDKLLDGKQCIYKYQCQEREKFQYEGKCFRSCPPGTKEDVDVYPKTCLAKPNLPLLLTLLFVALLVCIAICLCMTIPRNGERTLNERIKAIMTTQTKKQVYENHGFEEGDVQESRDADTEATPHTGEAGDVVVVSSVENVYFTNETDQCRQSEM